MISILLSWFYILFTSVVVGIFTAKFLKINTKSSVYLSLIGLFITCIFAVSWAFFSAVNLYFYGIYFLFVIVIGYFNNTDLKEFISDKIKFLQQLDYKLCLLAILFLLTIAIQAATKPTLPDNESYYIQTIKWINEYGFVKGLGNLHLFFAQTSGWHVLQSTYNFPFLTDKLNTLSSFISVLLVLFSIKNVHVYFTKKIKLNLIFGLSPIFFILFFPLLNVPSPDVATYCISMVLFFQFLENSENKDVSFKILVLFSLFLSLIKITNLPLLLLPFIYLLIEKNILIKNNSKVLLIGLLSFGLLFSKNAILTGYIFYPIHNFGIWNDFYKIPTTVLDYFFGSNMRYSFFMDKESVQNSGFFFIMQQWLFKSVTDLFFNASILFCFLISPFIIYKKRNNKKMLWLYIILLFQFILLAISSPQYRFFLGSLFFFFALIFSYFINSEKTIYSSMLFSLLLLNTYLFLPQLWGNISSNKIITSRTAISFIDLLIPDYRSSLKTDFTLKSKQKLHYYSPTNSDLFWETGNGKLPCVSQKQLEYFESYFEIIPQPIGTELQDGFYAKKITKP
jgi:hypothetical protein